MTTRGYARFLLSNTLSCRPPAFVRWTSLVHRQHSLADLVANVLSSLAGLSLCQHPFAGLLPSVLLSLASLLVSVLSSLADPACWFSLLNRKRVSN